MEPSDDGVIKIQTRVMGDFASAAFSTYSVFPEIPATLLDSVKYDAQNDEYILSLSDTGGTYTNLDAVSTLQDGSVIAIVGLYEGAGNPEDLLGSVTFTLVKKPSANENRGTNYLYSVAGVTKAPK